MKRLLFLWFVFVWVSCNEAAEKDTLLTQPPYKPLTDSIAQQPQEGSLYYRRGVLLYENNQKKAAENDLRTAWQLQPSEEHALSVVTLLINKHPDSAIQFIQTALQQLPKSIALQLGLARGFQQKNETEKAITVCDGILLLYPASLDALLLKADLLKSQNKNEDALATLEKAYRYAPSDRELAYNLAFEYAEAKNNKVVPLTDSLIQADSTGKQAQPYYLRGVYYANTGAVRQALSYFDQAITHDYTFFDAYMDKGALLFDQKRPAEALAVFRLVARISPTYADSYFWAGKCEEALGRKEDAKRSYQRAYALDNQLQNAKEAAARL
ncbi:MAG TPA: tetratricopeptide repeat protein [Chitinophagaceae bacterium]|nr:tetratricopeptide repeat protein [Chitinophagaceae bacterium]